MASPPPTQNGQRGASRNSSLGSRFLRRSKSTEPLSDRKSSGSRLLRKKSSEKDESARQREAGVLPPQPPTLPTFSSYPQLQSFGGEMPDRSKNSNMPVPPVPGGSSNEPVDPYARTESMTHRGRYSYASSAVSTMTNPRRVRRRKDPTPYNVLVIGSKNSGKTSFINFLQSSLALPPKKRAARGPEDVFDTPPATARANRNFTHHYLETEIDGERVGLTIWDSQGLEKNVVDLQLPEISAFIESKFDDTFNEEMKVVRAPGVQDTHIHLVFLIIDPFRLDTNIQAAQQMMTNGSSTGSHSRPSRFVGGLDEDFDVQVLRTLQGKTTVVPVISKADTITTAHMAFLKKTVSDGLKMAGLDPLEALHLDEDAEDDTSEDFDKLDEMEEDQEAARSSGEVNDSESPGTPRTEDSDTVPNEQPTPSSRRLSQKRKSSSSVAQASMMTEPSYLPLSILSPDSYSLPPNEGPVGRKFPWGFADPYDPEHCDFVKLKETCFGEWRADLREASRDVFYESWRTSRLNRHGVGANGGGVGKGARTPSGGIPPGILKSSRRGV